VGGPDDVARTLWALVDPPGAPVSVARAECVALCGRGAQEAVELAAALAFFATQERTRSSVHDPLPLEHPPVPARVRQVLPDEEVWDLTWAVVAAIATAGYVGRRDPDLTHRLAWLVEHHAADATSAFVWWAGASLADVAVDGPAQRGVDHVRELFEATSTGWHLARGDDS